MGEETRQITNKLEDTIMGIYNKVGDIAITQAVIVTKQDLMHVDVKKINSRVTSLETTRSESVGKGKKSASIKKGVAWGLGITCSVAGLIFGIMRMLQ